MMNNLFSIFDPTTNFFNLSLNWMSMILGIIFFLPIFFWLVPSRIYYFYQKIIFTLHLEFKLLSNLNSFNGGTLLFISLFSLIFFNNILGLFPYIFTSTSHLIMSLTLALPFWLSFMIFGWLNNTNHMFIHLLPQNTPNLLMPFMVMIESISILIRPITLSVRLMANMIAGHLLITLMSKTGIKMSLLMVNFLILSQVLLLTLESAVAIIQAYVFSILSNLYSNEVN
uniref:ATP synthase subunit a n=1 Tax=Anisocentropus maculatus TaxID=2904904 RepID=A0A9E8LNP9_9NEOP|nr:ATP synthase F0 subunit 6 [Anisocentropus maculatus]UZZ43757.1 ATP synthase F0 subunit 6 [Anisocentropus maculatus]